MILRAYERSELRLTDDYYCGKIEAAVNAYGMSYDFCRLYSVNEGLTWGISCCITPPQCWAAA